MAGAFSLPMAEIAVLLGEGKLKARALSEEAIANHGTIELLDTPGGGLTARVHLPPAAPTQHQTSRQS